MDKESKQDGRKGRRMSERGGSIRFEGRDRSNDRVYERDRYRRKLSCAFCRGITNEIHVSRLTSLITTFALVLNFTLCCRAAVAKI